MSRPLTRRLRVTFGRPMAAAGATAVFRKRSLSTTPSTAAFRSNPAHCASRSHVAAAWPAATTASRTVTAAAMLLLAGALSAAGQVSSASTAALGMGDNYTAAARGVDAVAWNPSVLGFHGGPRYVTLAVRGSSGLGPVGLNDISDWSDTLVPDGVKRDWLNRISADGGQIGSGGGEVTWLGFRLGPMAVHASSAARAVADVSPGIAELVLFGNVGASGQANTLDLSGSDLNAVAWSAVGASVGHAFGNEGRRIALGVTVKYVIGHALALGENSSGATTNNPIAVDIAFPLVHTSTDGGWSVDNGHGIGVDAGASLEFDDWTFSAVVHNLANSFAWDPASLRYRPLSVSLNQDSALSSTDAVALGAAPAAVQQRIAALKFEPAFAAGVAYRYTPAVLLSADARLTSPDGLTTGTAKHIGAGAELRPFRWLPIRLGGAMISMGENADGWQAGAGLGFDFGAFSLNASALRRDAGRFGQSTVLMLGLFSGGS